MKPVLSLYWLPLKPHPQHGNPLIERFMLNCTAFFCLRRVYLAEYHLIISSVLIRSSFYSFQILSVILKCFFLKTKVAGEVTDPRGLFLAETDHSK